MKSGLLYCRMAGELSGRRQVEYAFYWERNAGERVQFKNDGICLQGIASKIKEIIPCADALQAQDLLPHANHRTLCCI